MRLFLVLAAYTYAHDIATSAAVNEIKVVYLLIATILSCVTTPILGLFLFVLTDTQLTASIESTVATYGTVC